MRARLELPFSDKPTHCARILNTWIASSLKRFLCGHPGKLLTNICQLLLRTCILPTTRCIVDATEIFIDMPANPSA